jgi:hypothetical protein
VVLDGYAGRRIGPGSAMVLVLYRERPALEKPYTTHDPLDPEKPGRVILTLGEGLRIEEESTP